MVVYVTVWQKKMVHMAMLPYNNDLLYGNVTIQHKCYYLTMIFHILNLPYNGTMTYDNLYVTIWNKVVNMVILPYEMIVTV